MRHGRRILPHRIKEWLRNRGLHWACFCSLTLGGSRSTRIIESLNGSVYAFCNDHTSVCGFRSMWSLICRSIVYSQITVLPVNLSRVYETAIYGSEYTNLPVRCMSSKQIPNFYSAIFVAAGTPNMAGLRDQFLSVGSGPYFRGYCGEHESEYQETTQLAGDSLGKPSTPPFL